MPGIVPGFLVGAWVVRSRSNRPLHQVLSQVQKIFCSNP
ncbi:hypothetical protein MC7420_656 [Coleofasciculus chthonoplastes PCC 7420]|uniref:Uncharacterized protein n=1 Tax=Coleofasciculus chthonoplastes PCC 7420 TaxID=118168 RepID=B4VT81_9CYAN|nr:hypothetical protein MC7420_656 [Coleofasciculus chthonoplastes PCC 7420]